MPPPPPKKKNFFLTFRIRFLFPSPFFLLFLYFFPFCFVLGRAVEILSGTFWGPNLLVGTKNGLLLLDRDGEGKVRKNKPGKETQKKRAFFPPASLLFSRFLANVNRVWLVLGVSAGLSASLLAA